MEQHRLLIEDAFEMDTEIVEEINEGTGSKQKNYYIHGVFSTPDKQNRNGRVYSSSLWENNVEKYQKIIKEKSRNAFGELEHPARVDVDTMKAVMRITSLKMEDGVVKGRAKILNDNSPETNKIKALIDEGLKIGVSSRGTGRMKGKIVEEFNLSTYDIVQSPSDYNANLTGITESTESEVSLNESTGKWECDGDKCIFNESTHVKNSLDESKCSIKATQLLESLKEYSQVQKPISEFEIIAKELVEGNKSVYKKASDKLDLAIEEYIKTLSTLDKMAASNFKTMFKNKIQPFTRALLQNISEDETDTQTDTQTDTKIIEQSQNMKGK